MRRMSSAPLATTDRCPARSPKIALLSNTHCIGPFDEPDESLARDRTVEPEIHGHDRGTLHRRRVRERASDRGRRRRPTRATARATARPRQPRRCRWPHHRRRTPAICPLPFNDDAPGRSGQDASASRFDEPDGTARRTTRRAAPTGRPIAESVGDGPKSSASTRTKGAAAAASGDWFSAAIASGSHSHLRRAAVWRCAMSQADTVSAGGTRGGDRFGAVSPRRIEHAAKVPHG